MCFKSSEEPSSFNKSIQGVEQIVSQFQIRASNNNFQRSSLDHMQSVNLAKKMQHAISYE